MSDASAKNQTPVSRRPANAEAWSHPRDRFETELPTLFSEKLAALDRAASNRTAPPVEPAIR